MNYKTILVHLDPSPRSAARAALAARWARAFGSHLVGLVPTGLYDGVIPAEVISSDPEDTVAASDGYLRRRSDAIALAFKNSIAGEGPLSCEVRPSDDPTVDALVRHGHTSDLVVLGQDGADDHRDTTPHRLVDPVLLALGRPVLVLPSVGTVSDMPCHALVGWDGSRAAAVALGAERLDADETGQLVKGQPRHPIVEDDVVIYAGATILGRITIGAGSSIGGNVWLTRSVPAGSNITQANLQNQTSNLG